jgi:hypothetical protein
MAGCNIEQLWYSLCLIEAVVILFVISVIVLLCRRFSRRIPSTVLCGVQPNTRWCIRSAPCSPSSEGCRSRFSRHLETHWMGDCDRLLCLLASRFLRS